MARIAHIYGDVRAADLGTKTDAATGQSNVWGTRLSILTEPKGDTMEVTAFAREFAPADLRELEGKGVHAIVELEANGGRNGGAFLNATLRHIEPWTVPSAVKAA